MTFLATDLIDNKMLFGTSQANSPACQAPYSVVGHPSKKNNERPLSLTKHLSKQISNFPHFIDALRVQ